MELILADLVVLDLSRGIAGSYCAKLLADAGAEVLKIESESDPDPRRPRAAGDGHLDIRDLALFVHLNTSKKSVSLDPASVEGRDAILRLASIADAVVEDRAPGTLDGLRLSYEAFGAANPAIVLTSITPFGLTGPYRDYKANDLLLHAMASRMSSTGVAPRPPVRLVPDSSYYLAGTLAAGAILAAIWSARKDGLGDHLDISIMECLLGAPDRGLLLWEFAKIDMPRPTSPRSLQNFPCLDGFIAISMIRGIERVARAIGRPDLLSHPRFATNQGRQENSGELEAAVSAWTIERTKREAFVTLQGQEVICAPVNTLADLFEDPQFSHRGSFVDVTQEGQSFQLPGRPFRAPGKHPGPLAPPPRAGEHTEEVLRRVRAAVEQREAARQ